jgi:hypothetical protein
MAHEIIEEPNEPTHGTVHEILSKYSPENPEKINAKRERFLALLKSQYGYSNDKAVDELERLLKQFYRMNKSLNIHLARPSITIQARTPRKGRGNKLAGEGVD